MQEDFRANLDAACSHGVFDPSKFFRLWFDEAGEAYFFLFKKNLRVTNIQFVELINLIRTYTYEISTKKRKRQLLFLSSRSFKTALQSLVEEDREVSEVSQERLTLVSSLYHELLDRMVVFDIFHGSAVVFLPPSLELNIERIAYLSGYVHSCGRSVFIRAIDKLTKASMVEAIDRLLRRHPSKQPIFFAPYAHEDFTTFDRSSATNLRDGLDEVKLYVEKFYVEGDRLPEVLTELRDKFKDKLYVPPPGDYHNSHIELRKRQSIDGQRTIWLIVDFPVDDRGKRLEGRYLICYDQLHFNSCPFQIFDENKPAWVAHTTIPHSLARAMLNATLPWPDRTVKISDPFVGTGTTWFECLKFKEVIVFCSDLDPVAKLLVQDNLDFFSRSSDSLADLAEDIERFAEGLRQGFERTLFPESSSQLDEASHEWATNLLAQLFGERNDTDSGALFGPAVMRALETATFSRRLILYLGLRAQLRYSGAFSRQSIDRETALIREATTLARQTQQLSRLRKRMEEGNPDFGTAVVFDANYSKGSALNPSILKARLAEGAVDQEISISDCRELEKDSIDIIIADPPYGFNTSDPSESLGELYKGMIGAFIHALRDDGQLLICLPEISFTGRRLPTCTREGVVIHQILVAAEKAGKEAVQPALALPRHGTLLRPPYYWESEKALRRKILHFRLREKLPHRGDES